MKQIVCVIPCRNEKNHIEECIKAIFTCDLPLNFEIKVIVVDGISTDGTRDLLNHLLIDFQNLIIIDNYLQLTPIAFNLGIKRYPTADYVQIVGARHILSKDYLLKSLTILENDKNIWCVGGKIINNYENRAGELISKVMSTSFGMGLGNFRTLNKSGFTDTVTSPVYPYWVFNRIEFFDEKLVRNQDDDFNYRLINAGGKIFYCNEISLKYSVRGDIKQLWKQFFQYGYWKVFVNVKHNTITTLRQIVPPLFVLFICFSILSVIFFNYFNKFSSLIYTFYILLSVVYAYKLSSNKKEILVIPFIFPILHISYGCGYLLGFLHFVILKIKPSEKYKSLSR